MFNNTPLSSMAGCVHPYPSYAEAFRAMAGQFTKKKLKPGVKSLLRGILKFK